MDKAHGIRSSGMAEPWKQGYSTAKVQADVSTYQNDSSNLYNQIPTVES